LAALYFAILKSASRRGPRGPEAGAEFSGFKARRPPQNEDGNEEKRTPGNGKKSPSRKSLACRGNPIPVAGVNDGPRDFEIGIPTGVKKILKTLLEFTEIIEPFNYSK
jgi:hypothetical protein